MAGGITGALTQKYGPLPGWAWAGVAAAGAWLLLPRLRGAAGTTSSTTSASGPSSDSVYGLGYAQGLQAAGPAAPAPTAATPGRRGVVKATDPGYTGAAGIFASPTTQSGTIAIVPQGTSLNVSGPPITGQPWGGVDYWWPVNYGGQTGYVSGSLFQLQDSGPVGVGGPAPLGSRSADLMSPWHPLVTAHHSYPHFVRAVGGAPNHSREVVRVARQAGVHPARLMMLNPNPNGWVRVA